MEGFWIIQFKGIEGFGTGVVTLIGGKLFGGDSGFIYRGTYTEQGDTLTAQVQVVRYALGTISVMGTDNFLLQLQGTVRGDSGNVTGTIPGSSRSLTGTLHKDGSLPR